MATVERGRYRILHICVDVEAGGQDEVREMESRVAQMEEELRGFHLLGTDETLSWPQVSACNPTPTTDAESEHD